MRRRAAPHGQGKEPWEIVYFKLYKSQLPVVEKAIETAGLMLGSDKSRGYYLEMICADFLAGTKLPEDGLQSRNNAPPSPEASPVEAQRRRIQFTSWPSAQARRLAMSTLWFNEEPARSPYREAEHARRRCLGQPSHSLRAMPSWAALWSLTGASLFGRRVRRVCSKSPSHSQLKPAWKSKRRITGGGPSNAIVAATPFSPTSARLHLEDSCQPIETSRGTSSGRTVTLN